MSQHFLLSPAARSLSIAQVLRMSDADAFNVFQSVRFADNGGNPFCPHCGCAEVYTLAETPIRWKCAACRKKFSVTSGTIFHSRKLAIRDYLGVIALFCNGVKGTSALQMSRDMNINPKSAFVLLHKLREAMGAEVHSGPELSGIVEVDGMYTRGHYRQPNRKAERIDRHTLPEDRKQVVVVARERRGRARTWVVAREADGVYPIRQNVASGTEVHADEAAGWNILHASYPMKRVNHSVEYKSDDGACTNQAESFFARLRRSEMGIHHRISGDLLQAYADECAWREQPPPLQRRALEPDNRRQPRRSKVRALDWLLAPERGMSENPHEVAAITANAIIAKRADILFEIGNAEKQIERLRAELVHLDIVLRMFRPDLSIDSLPTRHRRPTKSPYFGHGELTQRIYDAIREHGTISSVDVAAKAMRDKGLDPVNDTATRSEFVKRLARVITDMRRRGKIERIGRGKPIRWQLAGQR